MLEVGAGSGFISAYFASRYEDTLRVAAVDVADQRRATEGFEFRLYDGTRLPFEDSAFDLVVSNHVIEHVGTRRSQQHHLRELARVLAPGGLIYLAAPSRWQPIEPHFGLPLLSWIPAPLRDGYVRLAGKGVRYDCNPMGHSELERMAANVELQARNINAAAFRHLCLARTGLADRCFRRIPHAWLQACYRLSPTMVYLLSREQAGE